MNRLVATLIGSALALGAAGTMAQQSGSTGAGAAGSATGGTANSGPGGIGTGGGSQPAPPAMRPHPTGTEKTSPGTSVPPAASAMPEHPSEKPSKTTAKTGMHERSVNQRTGGDSDGAGKSSK